MVHLHRQALLALLRGFHRNAPMYLRTHRYSYLPEQYLIGQCRKARFFRLGLIGAVVHSRINWPLSIPVGLYFVRKFPSKMIELVRHSIYV